MNIEPQQVETLLKEKKYDEVCALIKGAAEAPMTDKEKGAALVGIASVYMDVSNSIGAQYRDALDEAIAGMKAINVAETDMGDKIKLASVRQGLGLK